ncbi:hypothetical protein [Natronorubrum sp. DTA7]|uniref:hypothetical protein n=1 Tax=Natronorubrum sp. DTA7 TaxID=3447016 RepID=UPI003F879300
MSEDDSTRERVSFACDGPAIKPLEAGPTIMAEDDADRANEYEAEREAEIEDELERVDQDPDQVDAGDDDLGTQNAPREDAEDAEADN